MVSEIVSALGGAGNISEVTNCMTRLRVVVKDESQVDEEKLKSLDTVLGLVHDRTFRYEVVVGPGKSRKYADRCKELGIGAGGSSAGGAAGNAGLDAGRSTAAGAGKADGDSSGTGTGGNSRSNAGQAKPKASLKSALKIFADIFVPLIPGVVAAGLCQGLANLVTQLVPNYEEITGWLLAYQMLALVGAAFIPFLSAWVGYRAAERFGATPILGGIIGMITCLSNINAIAMTLGLYDESQPLASVLSAGRGGVLAAIVGAFILAQVEKRIRKRMPDSLDIVLTPLLSVAICTVPYVLVIMPVLGFVSSGISAGMTAICMSDNPFVRMIAGFLGAAFFLPLVAAGMHHGFVALYSIQLAELGYVTLYPALAMAGAGQVGAAAALWVKAKRTGNKELAKVIAGALPAGVLGVGEPLVYGVTLPLGRPFVTAGIGAGFGGAFVMLAQVAATSWGTSGILATFIMTAGPNGAATSMLCYLAGLLVSCAMGCLITWFFCRLDPVKPQAPEDADNASEANGSSKEAIPSETATAPGAAPGNPKANQPSQAGARRKIRHGAPLFADVSPATSFEHTIRDKAGIHARPAGKLAELAKGFDCEITVQAAGKSARADSIIELMSLGAAEGTLLRVEASGSDAQRALRHIRRFLESEL